MDCPKCKNPLEGTEEFCPKCGNRVPELLKDDPTCPHCGEDLEPDSRFCPSCGKSVSAASRKGTLLSDLKEQLKDELGAERDEIRGEGRSARPSRFGRARQAGPKQEPERPSGSYRSSFQSSLRKERPTGPDASSSARRERPGGAGLRSDPVQPLMDVKTRDLKVQVEYFGKVNYSLIHNNVPVIFAISIENTADEDAENVTVECWIAPDYGEPWQKTVPLISAGETHVLERIQVPVKKARLKEMREAEKASLRVKIMVDGRLCYSDTFPIEVLAYNEWFFHPEVPQLLATFVRPNDPAIDEILTLAKRHLVDLSGDDAFPGYQFGPEKARCMAEAVYLAFQKDLDIGYINPPRSFEQTGQKILLPAEIVKNRRGTCLDLSVLYAACLERSGLHSIILIIQGHAFLGCMLKPENLDEPAVGDLSIIQELIDDDRLLVMNSVTFTRDDASFEKCQEEGLACLRKGEFMAAIDVNLAGMQGIKPLP